MLCLDYSNLQESRNISKLYMVARGNSFHVYGLGMNVLNGIFYKRDVPTERSLDPGAIQNRRQQLFC